MKDETIPLTDLIFAINENGVAITPKAYFEENGYLLDTQVTCLLTDDDAEALVEVVDEMCDSMFVPAGVDMEEGFSPEVLEETRQGLLRLGLTEEPRMAEQPEA